MRAAIILLVAALAVAGPAEATRPAAPAEPALCVEAARVAARRHGIPERVMQAITLVETRRAVDGVARPWPWTLNIEGEGVWFESRAAALARARAEIAAGRRSIDLGCFQLNWRWHGQNFAGPDEMLEPARAADYAARFLAGLYAETGDWMRAAGRYHSRTPENAARYRGLIGRALARLGPAPEPPLPAPRARPPEPDAGPTPLIVLASARGGDAGGPRAPGGVALSIFDRAARPLIAARKAKP